MVDFLSDCVFEVGSESFTEGAEQSETISGALLSVLSLFGTVLGARNAFSSVEIIVSSWCEFSCCLKKSSSFASSDTVSVPSSKCSCKKNKLKRRLFRATAKCNVDT